MLMNKPPKVLLAILFLSIPVFAQDQSPAPVGPNPQAIADVASGARAVANASWWGFEPEDATVALQSAIDSKAKSVIVPYVGASWIVRPIRLRSDLELIFEPGVLVLAKRGEFKGKGDSLFSADDCENITIRGYGATLRMWKRDYQSDAYEKAEWRMALALRGCKNVLVEGLRLESSGGDGFYIGATEKNRWCENITIRDCIAHDHHRQGISVITAQNLLVENCVFSGTSGTAPEAGIDFEPNGPEERLVNCVVRNCLFQDNAGAAMQVYLRPLDAAGEPVSIRFENCVGRLGAAGATPEEIRQAGVSGGGGMVVGAVKDDGPQGVIEFVNCTIENIGREAVRVYDKSARAARVRFERCNWKSPWLAVSAEAGAGRAPVAIQRSRPSLSAVIGGIDLVDCVLYDDADRPALRVYGTDEAHGIADLAGRIWRSGPHAPCVELGPSPRNATLEVRSLSLR